MREITNSFVIFFCVSLDKTKIINSKRKKEGVKRKKENGKQQTTNVFNERLAMRESGRVQRPSGGEALVEGAIAQGRERDRDRQREQLDRSRFGACRGTRQSVRARRSVPEQVCRQRQGLGQQNRENQGAHDRTRSSRVSKKYQQVLYSPSIFYFYDFLSIKLDNFFKDRTWTK